MIKMNKQILIAGFGGQGILFAGKLLAYGGMLNDMEVSWLPSYGPEMRGGTANCSIILGDTQIGSPIVDAPDILIAMNAPSLDKYEDAVTPGGMIFADSSLISKKVKRTDISTYYIPATKLSSDMDLNGLANMIMIGLMLKHSDILSYEAAEKAMAKLVPARKQHLLEPNLKAIKTGYEYKED